MRAIGCAFRVRLAPTLRRARVKAADQSGASILIALLFALVVALVVAVVLSFSAVNGERTRQHAVEEQAYFAVQSAMGEADSLLGMQNAMHVVKKGGAYVGSPGITITQNDKFAAALAEWCATAATSVAAGAESEPYVVTAQYASKKDGETGAAIPSDITLKFEMDDQYNITVTAWQGDEDDLKSRGTYDSSADYSYPLVQTYVQCGPSTDDMTWMAEADAS